MRKRPVGDVNTRTGVKMTLLIFAALICDVPEAAVAQSELARREIVRGLSNHLQPVHLFEKRLHVCLACREW